MRPTRRVIIIHAQPTSSPPKPTASGSRSGACGTTFPTANQRAGCGCCTTILVPPQHRHQRANSPATQKEDARTPWSTGQQSRLMQDAAAPNPDPPRCNRSSQHAPGPSCDHHPHAADIVTAKANRKKFPDRGHTEQHFQWQVSSRAKLPHHNLNTTAAPHRHQRANSPATQKEEPRTSCSTVQHSRLMQDAAAQSPDHPRCNRSSQHAPGPSCDHHPRATDIVTAKAHRERFPVREIRNSAPSGKSADGLRLLHHNLTTTAWLVCDIINLFGATLKMKPACMLAGGGSCGTRPLRSLRGTGPAYR